MTKCEHDSANLLNTPRIANISYQCLASTVFFALSQHIFEWNKWKTIHVQTVVLRNSHILTYLPCPVTFTYDPGQQVDLIMQAFWDIRTDQQRRSCCAAPRYQHPVVVIATMLHCKSSRSFRQSWAHAVTCPWLVHQVTMTTGIHPGDVCVQCDVKYVLTFLS